MSSPRVIAVVQARMGSTRLPGKVLADLNGQPVLSWVVARASMAEAVARVVVATSARETDDPIAEWAAAEGIPCHRGSEEDVLERVFRAATEHEADVVVRITADCPLIAPDLIREVVTSLLTEPSADYASNALPTRTFPRGLDVEAMTIDALGCAWREASERREREHVTPFLYERPERFELRGLTWTEDLSGWRWTVDTKEDLELIRRLVAAVPDRGAHWTQFAEAQRMHPEWLRLNSHIRQKEA